MSSTTSSTCFNITLSKTGLFISASSSSCRASVELSGAGSTVSPARLAYMGNHRNLRRPSAYGLYFCTVTAASARWTSTILPTPQVFGKTPWYSTVFPGNSLDSLPLLRSFGICCSGARLSSISPTDLRVQAVATISSSS